MSNIIRNPFKNNLSLSIFSISILLIFFSFATSAFASNYYVSSTDGDDTCTGLSQTPYTTGNTACPIKTLTKLNTKTFSPGDNIYFKSNDTFYGSLTIASSGTSGSPITFTSYGSGSQPVISGFTDVTSWTNLGGNIWESTNAVSTLPTLNMVTVNGVNTPMGRYPNFNSSDGGYLTYESYSGNSSITDTSLSATPNWTGAEVVIRKSYWIMDANTITSQSGGTLSYTARTGYSNQGTGHGYFIQNDPRTLDQQGEWYYNPATGKIQMYSAGQPSGVKVSTVDNIISFSTGANDYVTFDGLAFEGANTYIFSLPNLSDVRYLNIANSRLSFAGDTAINDYQSSYFTLQNSTIEEANRFGYKAGSNNNYSIIGNTFRNIGLNAGMGLANQNVNNTSAYSAIQVWPANNSGSKQIHGNTIYNIGYLGMYFHGDNTLVDNNYVHDYMKVMGDGGGIYTYSDTADTTTISTGIRILNNVVLNGGGTYSLYGVGSGYYGPTGVGIYLDGSANSVEIAGNTVAHMSEGGIHMNGNRLNNIHDNIFYDVGEKSIDIADSSVAIVPGGNTITNNQSYSLSTTQKHFALYDDNLNLNQRVFNFGTSNYNTFASFNSTAPSFLTQTFNNGYKIVNYTFDQWKTTLQKDLNSTASSFSTATSSVLFDYNPYSYSKTISLSGPMVNVTGTKYTGTYTIPAYSSVVLIPDTNPTPSDTTAPVISSFVIPTTSSTLAISFTAPTATDAVGVTGYLLTETATTPSAASGSWTASAPTTYTFATQGSKTLYLWAKDAAGNVSTSALDTIVVTLPITTYTLTYTANANGTITGTSPQTVNSGSSGTAVTASPSTGYSFVSWSDGSTSNPRTDTNVIANKSVSATFAINTYTITATTGANGTITPAGATIKNYATSQTYTITPYTGYHIVSVTVDGVSQGAISTYTFTNITTAHTISATFAIDTFTITSSVGSNGTISPVGTTTKNYGTNQLYTITPSIGYHIVSVLVDGVSQGAVSTYTFTNVTATHTISATFAIDVVSTSTISNVSATATSTSSVTITWTTSQAGNSQSEYGLTSSYGSTSTLDNTLLTLHTVTLSNLKRNTTYHYRVKSIDSLSNLLQSADQTVKTLSQLTRTPKVGSLRATSGSVNLSWSVPLDPDGNPYELYSGAIIMRSTTSFIQTVDTQTALADVKSPDTTYHDSAVTGGVTYYYTVFAYDNLGVYSDPEFVSFTPAVVASSSGGSSGGGGGGGGSSSIIICPAGTTLVNTTCVTNTVASATLIEKAKSKDIKSDGSINIIDFNIIMANWNKTYDKAISLTKGDITGDGKVDIFDMNQLMVMWGVKY